MGKLLTKSADGRYLLIVSPAKFYGHFFPLQIEVLWGVVADISKHISVFK